MRFLFALMLLMPLAGRAHETVIYSAGFPPPDNPPLRQVVIYESTRYGDDWGRGFAISPRQVYDIRIVPYGTVTPSDPVQPPKSYGYRAGRLEKSGVRRDASVH